MARAGILVGGMVLLIVGIGIYVYGSETISQVESCLQGFICAMEASSNSALLNQQYAQGQILEIVGGIVAFIGFIMVIVGAVTESQSRPSVGDAPFTQSAQASPLRNTPPAAGLDEKFCPRCGNRIAKTFAYCPICGTTQPM